MNQAIPINITLITGLYLFSFLVAAIMGVRSLIRYQSLRTPLTLYYGLTGVTAALYFFFYAVPFIFTHNPMVLRWAIAAGDFFFYALAFIQARIIWYLVLSQKKISFWWLGTPVIIIAATAWFYYTFRVENVAARLSDPNAVYTAPLIARRLDALISLLFFGVAVLLIRQALLAKNKAAKLRLALLSLVYIFTGFSTIYNSFILHGSGDSFLLYTVLFIIFLTFLFSLLGVRRKQDQPPPPAAVPPPPAV